MIPATASNECVPLARYPAPAKLNLFLHVVGRRADGYHLLQTVFRFLSVGDELEIHVRQDGQIRLGRTLPDVPESQDLCWRAASLLKTHTGCALGADITLHKNLPMGGGLGGGSSDAATVLLVLNRLWGLHLPRLTLQQLGLQLGADVPVFVFGRAAFAEGVGEILTPWNPAPASYVVLTPKVHVATPAIFAHPALTRNTPSVTIAALSGVAAGQVSGGEGSGAFHNDLEPVATVLYPEVDEALACLRRAGAGGVQMTGSGACVFAPCKNQETATTLLQRCLADSSAAASGLGGFVASGVDQHPLFAWAD